MLMRIEPEQTTTGEENNDKIAAIEAEKDLHRRRMEWLKANREEYGGQYVALDGDKLLGTGKNYPEAYEHARRAGVKNALVDYVSKPDEMGYMGGWE